MSVPDLLDLELISEQERRWYKKRIHEGISGNEPRASPFLPREGSTATRNTISSLAMRACDLAQAKSGRVLIAQVHDAQKLVESGVLKGPIVRDQMRRHMLFGW